MTLSVTVLIAVIWVTYKSVGDKPEKREDGERRNLYVNFCL